MRVAHDLGNLHDMVKFLGTNLIFLYIRFFFLELDKYHVIYVAIKNEWDVITHKLGITSTANLHEIRNQAVEEDPFLAGICG